jgi:hypothetical protein
MKKIFLPLLFLLSSIAYSQELDESFLASLPEDVRQDIEEKKMQKQILKNQFTGMHLLS